MNSNELVPEFHDIGKLVDERAIASSIPGWPDRCKHTFTDFRDQPITLGLLGLAQPDNATWYGILNHHPERLSHGARLSDSSVKAWRGDPAAMAVAPQLLLLIVADHLASSTSRVLGRGGVDHAGPPLPASEERICLWRNGAQSHRAPTLIRTREELAELLSQVAGNPTDAVEYFARYGDRLRAIPEDKSFPRPVTTLETHARLVGRYYRVLRRYSVEHSGSKRRFLEYNGITAESVAEIENRWSFRAVRCRLRFPAVPARLRDLGIFERVETVLDDLRQSSGFDDFVLFSTFENIWLFLPVEEVVPLRQLVQPLAEAGIELEAWVRQASLGALMDRDGSETWQYLQRELAEEIAPPLCEVCQLAPGKTWRRRPDDVAEALCDACSETRDRYSHRFERLEGWRDGYAAWIRIAMDPTRLETHLRDLFRRFLQDRAGGSLSDEARHQLCGELRTTALSADYISDFADMLADFSLRLGCLVGSDRLEAPTARRRELMVIHLQDRTEVLRLIQLFYLAAIDRFPASLADPPFRLAVSVAPVHFPFPEHWRLLESGRAPVEVYVVGSGRMSMRLPEVPRLVLLSKDREIARRGLHRLADLARESDSLAQCAMEDRDEDDLYQTASRLSDMGLDFEGMRTFAELVRDRT